MINRSYILLVLSLLLLAGNVWGATYYVDHAGGNDANSGTSPSNAWKTISKVNRSSFSAGDSILFKRGETWQESMTMPSSGSAGAPITVGAYGLGELPVFYGGKTIDSGSWRANDPVIGVWSYFTYPPLYAVWQDDVPLLHASSSSCTNGNWYHDGIKVYYKPTTGTLTNHVIEVPTYGLNLNNKSYITVDSIAFTKYYYGVFNEPVALTGAHSKNISVQNCNFTNVLNAVSIRTNNTTSTSILISNNTFDYNSQSIMVGGYGLDAELYPHSTDLVTISNNTINHCSQAYGAVGYDWKGASGSTLDVEGIGVQNLTNSNICNNTISGACRGIFLYIARNGSSYNNNIYRNFINTARFGISIGGSDNTDVYNNKIYYNVVISTAVDDTESRQAGIILGRLVNSSGSINKLYNNTVNGNKNNLFLMGSVADNNFYFEIKNNIFGNPTNLHILESPVAKETIYDHNLYYPAGNDSFYTNSTYYNYTNWKAIDGRDAYSRIGAPNFVNAGSNNYALLLSSPAINGGTDVNLTSDFLGNPVPFGSAPDIGAYEYISSSKVISSPSIIGIE